MTYGQPKVSSESVPSDTAQHVGEEPGRAQEARATEGIESITEERTGSQAVGDEVGRPNSSSQLSEEHPTGERPTDGVPPEAGLQADEGAGGRESTEA